MTGPSPAYWATWSNGPGTSDKWFPLGAWMTEVEETGVVAPYADLGAGFKDVGINMILNSWSWLDNPGRSFLARCKALGLKVIASVKSEANPVPNMAYLAANPDHASTIIGWALLPDEPDWGGNKTPAQMKTIYGAAKAVDPSRPLQINFTKHMCDPQHNPGYTLADLQKYQSACDSVSFDAYYYSDPYEPHHGAYMYGLAVDNTRHSAPANKPIWGFVEAARLDPSTPTISPAQLEAAVWQMVIHGARGIMYFLIDVSAGQDDRGPFKPGYPGGPALIAKMKAVNARITGLASVLNSPQTGAINATSGREQSPAAVTSTGSIPVDTMVRRTSGGQTYLFAQAGGNDTHVASGNTTATFIVARYRRTATVLNENRTITVTNGVFTDTFTPYQVHIYLLA